MILPTSEALTVEFKFDRECLADRDLVEAIVCLANTDSGTLHLGVEDDGTPTGLHEKHRHLSGLGALVANRTTPPVIVQVDPMKVNYGTFGDLLAEVKAVHGKTSEGV